MEANKTVTEHVCPLCGRMLGTVNIDRHHLIRKTFKGKDQFPIRQICHRNIHSEEMAALIAWVAKKVPRFCTKSVS